MAGGFFSDSNYTFFPGSTPLDPNINFKNQIEKFLKDNFKNYNDFLIKYNIVWVNDSTKKYFNSKSYLLLTLTVKENKYVMYTLCDNSILKDIKKHVIGNYNLAIEIIFCE